ncbi:MAG: alginate export family protein [Pseudomonadota bacterium]
MNQQSLLVFNSGLSRLVIAALLAGLANVAGAEGGSQGQWDWSLRYRLEFVDDDGFIEDAEASTLRARLGYLSPVRGGFSFRVQVEGVAHIGLDDFNDTRNGKTEFPTVADPDGINLNEAYLAYGTDASRNRITAGRRAINLDDQRFIGSVAWRQNEQTYDSLYWDFAATETTTVSYGYVDSVRRIFGPDSGTPPRSLDSDSHLLHLSAKLPFGQLSAYGYWLEFDNAATLSNRTFGVRLGGTLWEREAAALGYQVEFASQSDYENNPNDYDANYYLAEIDASASAWSGTLGLAVLEGDESDTGQHGFITPLATLHKFQGFADLFLNTPGFGVVDGYARVQYKHPRFTAQVIYHDFEADLGSADLGTELDLVVTTSLGRWGSLLLKYANYDADTFGNDREIVWLQYLIAD